ncbi:MAG TPA: hypothetical protein VGZ00_04550 [Candidatus Baltobacteraceae bacterium]|jgi:hypothetical protein|nr:hypothetical protein [Candidatus Baltobacteraceae bacterium]
MKADLYAPTRWTRGLVFECIVVALISLIAITVSAMHNEFSITDTINWIQSGKIRSTFYNNDVLLANALLNGRVWIPKPDVWIDALVYHGKHYIIEGPFPALLVMPLVMIFGVENANQTLASIFFGAVATTLGWYICVRLGVKRGPRLWLTLFLLAGTDLWWCAELGDVWFFAHVVVVVFVFLALLELLGRRRGWLVALYACCAAETRFTLLLALPFFAYILASGGWYSEDHHLNWRSLRGFTLTVGVGTLLWVVYNELRWGLPYDIGYTNFYRQDTWGQTTGSPFRLSYVPYQLYSYFMRPPDFVEYKQLPIPPYFKVNMNGIALPFTSPALILVFFSQIPQRLKVALWTCIILIALPNFAYYLNGWYQFGMRHALDFEPFLFVLMAYAVRERMPHWGALLCAYSAAVGVWGVWFWDVFIRAGD